MQRQLQFRRFQLPAVLLQYPGDDTGREVLAAQLRFAGRRDDLQRPFKDFHDGHVERSAAEVHDDQFLLGVPVVIAVQQRGGRGLVDDPPHVQTGHFSGRLGCLALVVVEVRRNRNDGVADFATEETLGVFTQRAKHETGQFGTVELLSPDFDPLPCAHPAFEARRTPLGLRHAKVFRGCPDDDLATRQYAHNRGREHVAMRIANQTRRTVPEDTAQRVRCAQVNADDQRHRTTSRTTSPAGLHVGPASWRGVRPGTGPFSPAATARNRSLLRPPDP